MPVRSDVSILQGMRTKTWTALETSVKTGRPNTIMVTRYGRVAIVLSERMAHPYEGAKGWATGPDEPVRNDVSILQA